VQLQQSFVLDDADCCVCAFCAAALAVLLHVLFLHAGLASRDASLQLPSLFSAMLSCYAVKLAC
jgi:hypothetical protein